MGQGVVMSRLLSDPGHSEHLAAAEALGSAEDGFSQCSLLSSHTCRSQDEGIATLGSAMHHSPDNCSGKGGIAGRKSLIMWNSCNGGKERASMPMRRKSSLRTLSGKRSRKKKSVRFHGIRPSSTNWSTFLVSIMVATFRPSSNFAMAWEVFTALSTAADLILLPLGVLGRMFKELTPEWHINFEPALARRLSQKHKVWSTVEMAVDGVFVLDLIYRVCRAFVYDLGFHDSPVDRLVVSTTKNLVTPSIERERGQTTDSNDATAMVCHLCLR